MTLNIFSFVFSFTPKIDERKMVTYQDGKMAEGEKQKNLTST